MSQLSKPVNAEAIAKAALLGFLREQGRLSHKCVATTELILDKHTVRADIVVADASDIYCFEIKTERDTLGRLDKQINAYAMHADFVTVVAASRHINAVLSRAPDYVGVYEMLSLSEPNEIRVVREPQRSPAFDADALLSILPVSELRTRLSLGGRQKRQNLIEAAANLTFEKKKRAALAFLHERYYSTTRALMQAARRRAIQPKDLNHLRKWKRLEVNCDKEIEVSQNEEGKDANLYETIGKSFGPVPDHIRMMLAC